MTETALIVDDSSFQRSIIRDILTDRFDIVGEAEDGDEALERFRTTEPDFVTMDIAMPNTDGIEATKRIKSESDDVTILMCTSMEQDEQIKSAIKYGADGYVIKPISETDLLKAAPTV